MGATPNRYRWFALSVAIAAVALAAAPAVVQLQQVAHAEQIRRRCVREFSAKNAWRAEITETETGSDGTSSVVRQQLLVRKPGEYRLTLHEQDSEGGVVVSTTVRAGQAFYTRRTNADGSTELHIVRNVRPSLGVETDNLLGQTVEAVDDSKPLKVVGAETRNGVTADKLELGPGRFVWVARSTGLPLEEQVVSGGKIAHRVVIDSFDDRTPVADRELDPEALAATDATTVEDLGFRPVAAVTSASSAIGFTPLVSPAPLGFALDVQGYVDPNIPNGDGATEGAFVSAFSSGVSGVLVSQVMRAGAGDSFVPDEADEGSFRRVEVAGMPAAIFDDGGHPRLVFVRGDILVTIEGDLSAAEMTQLAEGMRSL